MTDVWNLATKNILSPKNIDMNNSFYCGDAAGRPASPGRKKDFNITDRYFAQNIGIKFYTPEILLAKNIRSNEGAMGEPSPKNMLLVKDPYLTKLDLTQFYPETDYPLINVSTKNLIILVGAQASGKSTLAKIYRDYVYLSNDLIKNKKKLNRMFNQSLLSNKNIIIDNTNPKKDTRASFIGPAIKSGYRVYCYFINFPKLMAQHMNNLRVQITHGKIKHMSKIAYNIYYKNLEPPEISEGFDEIIEITRLHKSQNTNKEFEKYYWYSYDLK